MKLPAWMKDPDAPIFETDNPLAFVLFLGALVFAVQIVMIVIVGIVIVIVAKLVFGVEVS